MSPDTTLHSRSIYTVWDFLGDVGGLFDMIRLLTQPIVTLSSALLGTGLHRFLISALFKIERRQKPEEHFITHIRKRKPFHIQLCSWLCSQRNKRYQSKAEDIIANELDIVNFLKHQMINTIQLRLQFTKFERFLLRNQSVPFVPKTLSKRI